VEAIQRQFATVEPLQAPQLTAVPPASGLFDSRTPLGYGADLCRCGRPSVLRASRTRFAAPRLWSTVPSPPLP